jgi:hypothetical protein
VLARSTVVRNIADNKHVSFTIDADRVRVKLAELYQHSNAHTDIPVIASLRDRILSLCASQPA